MALLITFGLGITIGWKYFAPQVPPAPPIQFEVAAPPGANFTPAAVASTPQIAVSPDGHWLAFVAAQRRMPSQIRLRPLEGRDAVPLADTKGAHFPLWSPDSRFIAFFADAKQKD